MIKSMLVLTAAVLLLLATSAHCRGPDGVTDEAALPDLNDFATDTTPPPPALRDAAVAAASLPVFHAGENLAKAATAQPRVSDGHFSIAFNGEAAASGDGVKVCFDLSSSVACDPAASPCCAAGSPTPNAGRIVELQLKLDPAAVTECLTGADQLKSFKQLLWTVNGAKAAARYVPTSEILSIKRKWLGSATLCVEMPAGNTNPCAAGGLDKICGAGGCQVTAVTTKFDQAGDTNKIKKSCKLAATVPLTENACQPGFVSPTNDGKNCQDIDECSAGTNPCGSHSTCTNTAGGYLCACSPGYGSPTANGKNCGTCAYAYDSFAPRGSVGWRCASTGGDICRTQAMTRISFPYQDDRLAPVPIASLKVEMDGRVCASGVRMKINGVLFGDPISGANCTCPGNTDCTTKTWATTDPAALAAFMVGGQNWLMWTAPVEYVNLRVTVSRPDNVCEDCQGVVGASLSCGNNKICSTVANGCVCKPGFLGAQGDADQCTDMDECLAGAPCPSARPCTNMPGTYACNCPVGTVDSVSTFNCTAARTQVSFSGVNCISNCLSYTTQLSGQGFALFGTVYPSFRVYSNGMLSFDVAGWILSNQDLPTTELPYRAAVLPFHDDLIIDKVYMAYHAWNGAGATVIEWYNATLVQDQSARITFQAWLFYDGRIGFRYVSATVQNALTTGSSATIGMQLAPTIPPRPYYFPTKFIKVSYNTAGAVTFGSTALLFTPTTPGDAAPYYTHGAWASPPTDVLGP